MLEFDSMMSFDKNNACYYFNCAKDEANVHKYVNQDTRFRLSKILEKRLKS